MVHAYIYNLPIITKNSFVEHIKALEKVLQKLAEAGFKVNAENSCFITQKLSALASVHI